jgi:hypothetical protein
MLVDPERLEPVKNVLNRDVQDQQVGQNVKMLVRIVEKWIARDIIVIIQIKIAKLDENCSPKVVFNMYTIFLKYQRHQL